MKQSKQPWTFLARLGDHGAVTLPPDYAHEHVRLGYAATEHGYQSKTVDHAIALTSSVTTCRGVQVAATRGRVEQPFCVVTDSDEDAEARGASMASSLSTAPRSPPSPNAARWPNSHEATSPTLPPPQHRVA